MVTVIIKNDGEDKVTKLTYENLYHELKDIPGSELVISKSWFEDIPLIKNSYVCLVEADCLVSPGYFVKQMKEIKINPGRKISALTARTSVNWWDICFYGYYIDFMQTDEVIPNRSKKSSKAYPVQVGYIPGAIIRRAMLLEAIEELEINDTFSQDLVYLSGLLSMAFWRQGKDGADKKVQNGNPVYVNPNVTYVTTEDYVNDIGKFDLNASDLANKFVKESI